MWIDESTSARELAALTAGDHRSERRRKELQRLGNVLTDSDVRIKVTFQDAAAFAHSADENELHDFEVHIPVKQFEQVETDMRDPLWNRRVQVGLLFHELGHVFYSDFERFENRQQEVPPQYTELFRTICNAGEDVAIEAQLAREFDIKHDFRTLNETFRARQKQDHQRYLDQFGDAVDDHFSYTVFEALEIAILSRGFGEERRFTAILDPADKAHQIHGGRRDVVAELAPALNTFVDDVLSTPDGAERVDRAFAFFERTRDALANLPSIQTVRVQTEGFRPIDAGTYVIGGTDDATALPEPADGPTSEPRIETADDTPSRGSETGNEVSRGADNRESPGNDGESVGTLLGGTGETGESPLRREAETLLDIIQSDETDLQRAGVVEIDEGEGDPQRWEQARRRAGPLAADLRSVLRRRRRADVQPGHRAGQIDPHRIVQAVQGRNRVFQKREAGDERDYSCLIILDRSGSMDTEMMTAAENATVQLVHAFTEVGVDVSVLSLWQGCPWLELPFGGEPHRYVSHLTSGRTGGGTPLSGAIEIARERVATGAGHQPFVVVVTDGMPDDEQQYAKVLSRCSFEVYGVYVDGAPGAHAQYFDRIVYTGTESVAATLRQLARQFVD